MILIIEGMDRCGKDSLIKHLRANVLTGAKTTMIHCSSPPDKAAKTWAIRHYYHLLEEVSRLNDTGWDIILNRSHLGENVYGPIFRKTEAGWVYDLDDIFLSDRECLLVTLLDSPERAIARDDGESLSKNVDDIQLISDQFVKVHNESKIKNKVLYNYKTETDKSIEKMTSDISIQIKRILYAQSK